MLRNGIIGSLRVSTSPRWTDRYAEGLSAIVSASNWESHIPQLSVKPDSRQLPKTQTLLIVDEHVAL
jgi:hypothetical protein